MAPRLRPPGPPFWRSLARHTHSRNDPPLPSSVTRRAEPGAGTWPADVPCCPGEARAPATYESSLGENGKWDHTKLANPVAFRCRHGWSAQVASSSLVPDNWWPDGVRHGGGTTATGRERNQPIISFVRHRVITGKSANLERALCSLLTEHERGPTVLPFQLQLWNEQA